MLFAIHCLDGADALPRRLAHHAAHRAHLAAAKVRLLVAGPLLGEDGGMIGSLFVVQAASWAEAEAFHRADPFVTAGVWERVTITGFDMRTDNRALPEAM
jgi:uncharacterized protein YciI